MGIDFGVTRRILGSEAEAVVFLVLCLSSDLGILRFGSELELFYLVFFLLEAACCPESILLNTAAWGISDILLVPRSFVGFLSSWFGCFFLLVVLIAATVALFVGFIIPQSSFLSWGCAILPCNFPKRLSSGLGSGVWVFWCSFFLTKSCSFLAVVALYVLYFPRLLLFCVTESSKRNLLQKHRRGKIKRHCQCIVL